MYFKSTYIKAILLTLITLSTVSCATPYRVRHSGMARVRHYNFINRDVPPSFDGTSIVFASDLHYKSKFREKRLKGTIETISRINPDLLLLGGDYKEGCENISPLFDAIGKLRPRFGIYAVMGNNDYETCYDETVQAMKDNGIELLEHKCDTIKYGNEEIIIAGIRNPFDKKNLISPTLSLNDSDFVIMLVHTPDYAEDTDITNTDLVLAGHTHGGQVTLFGIYAPVLPSKYGQRFRTGLKHNSKGIPVIITNGLGTSQKNIRMFAPSEIIWIHLRCENEKSQEQKQ